MSLVLETAGEKTIEHITPSIDVLTAVQSKVICTETGCGKVFSLPQNYDIHFAQCHKRTKLQAKPKKENYEEWYHCPVENCRYNSSLKAKGLHFLNKKSLKQHYLKVHAEKHLECDTCDHKFSAASFLKAHKLSCGKELSCTCGSIFSSIPALQTHARRTKHYVNLPKKTLVEKLIQPPEVTTDTQVNPTKPRYRSIQPSCNAANTAKTHHPHIVAAIALSELGVARIKRISTCDVGIQTDSSPPKRISRRSSAGKDTAKRTAETQTQTHLTHLEKKPKRTRKTRSISTSATKKTRPVPVSSDTGVTAGTQTATGTCPEVIPTHMDYDPIYQHNCDMNPFLNDFLTAGPCPSHGPSLSHSSSSMETQTDVLFGPDRVSPDDPAGIWCSSETQTYENFSDIEQFLCSTAHTQTQEDTAELFPELNFSDTHTQTGLDEGPALVDTQTQTLYMWSF